MLAHVSFTPVGTGEETKELIAKAMTVVVKSELEYQLTAMGIIIEGEWEEVMYLIKKCHDEVKTFSERVVTNITADDRKDLQNRLKNNVLEIECAVGGDLKTAGLT